MSQGEGGHCGMGTGPASWARDLCGLSGPPALNNPILGLMLCIAVLKFLITFEQGKGRGVSHFHFALGPTKYIAGPGWGGLRAGSVMSISGR